MVGHFKLKLWAFFWGQGEREWPLHYMDTSWIMSVWNGYDI